MAMWTVSLFLGFLLLATGHTTCPSGWSGHESRCFKFFNTKIQWHDAEHKCLERGANLASVHSIDENTFLQSLIKQNTGSLTPTWVGGHDGVAEGQWFWSDGSEMVFQMWSKKQPDNLKDNEDCLELNYRGYLEWNDVSCILRRPFVCALKIQSLSAEIPQKE